MKRLIIYILPLLFFAQIAMSQPVVVPHRIPVLRMNGGSGTNKVDSATTSNDSLYYWINGSKHFGGLVGSGGSVTISPGTGVTITGTGTSIDPYVINATGGSGGNGGRYIIPDYGIIVDSSVSNQYKIRVDSATLKDSSLLYFPLRATPDQKSQYIDTFNLHQLRYSLANRSTGSWTDTTLADKKYVDSSISNINLPVYPIGTGVQIISPKNDTLYYRTFANTYGLNWDTASNGQIRATIDTSLIHGGGGGVGGTPGGNLKDIQFKTSSGFGGNDSLTYDPTTGKMIIGSSTSGKTLFVAGKVGFGSIDASLNSYNLTIKDTSAGVYVWRNMDSSRAEPFIVLRSGTNNVFPAPNTGGGQVRGIADYPGLRFTDVAATTEWARFGITGDFLIGQPIDSGYKLYVNGNAKINGNLLTNLTKGSIPFIGTSGLITQSNSNYFYDSTNNRVGIGTSIPQRLLDVHSDGGTIAQISGSSNTSTTYPRLFLTRTEGTYAAPTVVNSGDGLGSILFTGQQSTTIGYIGGSAEIKATAAGTFSGSSYPSFLSFSTTPASSITPTERMRIDPNGLVGINTTAGNSTLHDNGSFATAYIGKTANYTATISDHTIDCTSGTFTVTLPTAVGIAGREYVITNSNSGTITIATTSSQTFTNITATPTTLTIATLGTYKVQATGANWVVISKL